MTSGLYFHAALTDLTLAPGAHGKDVALGAIQVTRQQPGQSRSPTAWTPSDGRYVPTGSRATATASNVTWSLSLPVCVPRPCLALSLSTVLSALLQGRWEF